MVVEESFEFSTRKGTMLHEIEHSFDLLRTSFDNLSAQSSISAQTFSKSPVKVLQERPECLK